MTGFRLLCFLVLLACLGLPAPAQSQQENRFWYFGEKAGLDFGSGNPVEAGGAQLDADVSASVSDSSGRLLFYTDGRTVWDRRHRVMPNGTGLLVDSEWPQSVALVPVVDAPGKYYLFTVSTLIPEARGGILRYSVIDLSRNGGFGEVEAEGKNTVLRKEVYPVLITFRDECGVWLLTCDWTLYNACVFVAYRVDFKGIDFPRMVSYSLVQGGQGGFKRLMLRMSPDRNILAVAAVFDYRQENPQPAPQGDFIYLFRFLPDEGRIIRFGSIDHPGFQDVRGLAFSPEGSFLYTNERSSDSTRSIYQYDFRQSEPGFIAASRQEVGRAGTDCGTCLGTMAAGPDGRIYVARKGKTTLGVVREPGRQGVACEYMDEGVSLGTKLSRWGLPNEYTPNFQVNEPLTLRDTLICSSISLDLAAAPGFSAYRWQDGSAGRVYQVNSPGQYRLMATYDNCVIADTVDIRGRIDTDGVVGPDTILCPGRNIRLDASFPGGIDYRWSDGLTGPGRVISDAAQYWVEFSNGECRVRDSIQIRFFPEIPFDLGPDTLLCQDEELLLKTETYSVKRIWQDGSTAARFRIRAPGIYWVDVLSSDGCAFRDSIEVRYSSLQPPRIEGDRSPCEGEPGQLLVYAPGATRLSWEDGTELSARPVIRNGVYTVEVSDGYCRFSDSARVEFRNCCRLFIPNVFSPDSDGVNDRFLVFAGCPLSAVRLRVFSRLGQLLFETGNLEAGWDGTFRGQPMPSGQYMYLVDYRFERDGKYGQERGGMVLMR